MRTMTEIRWRRAVLSYALALGFIVGHIGSADAAPMALRADVGVDRPIDVAAFERFIAARYHIQLRKVVAADIDRDGDIDVVGATDGGFIVWVNDGNGHLTSQP